MGLGRQVHFSQRITMVMNMMTPPEALNTRVVESVLLDGILTIGTHVMLIMAIFYSEYLDLTLV